MIMKICEIALFTRATPGSSLVVKYSLLKENVMDWFQIEDQQLGCLWSGKHLVSVSLSGNINYLDPDSPAKPSKVIRGHNKPITKMTSRGDTLVTAGSDGRVIEWNVSLRTLFWKLAWKLRQHIFKNYSFFD